VQFLSVLIGDEIRLEAESRQEILDFLGITQRIGQRGERLYATGEAPRAFAG